MPKDFLSILDLTPESLRACLDLASAMKAARREQLVEAAPLSGKHVALLFEKPSLRTRATFTIAVRELGGDVIEPPADVALGGRESLADVARNLERWVSACVVRTYEQARLAEFAAAAPRMHVVNALTNEEHPCQALADMLSLREHLGSLEGARLAYVGDGNNVAASLAQAGLMLGVSVRIASPKGYELPEHVASQARAQAAHGARLVITNDPVEAVKDADAVYTDVWASMGQEDEAASRDAIFRRYQVNEGLMGAARPQAAFMHCLPAHRGDEVTDAVMDSARSIVFEQAENRLHTQKALLAMLTG
ncbi:MAG TPA: ornithine carbamoyltransferase [Vicinamibacterales bacterium]|nr:ornithine carbamoyltransferase [Vicinamibacterales bacterium]